MSEEQAKVKITVLKVFKPEEVFKEPPVKLKVPHPCPVHKVGQTFLLEGYNQPEGVCGFAWNSIMPWAVMLKNHGDLKWHYEEPGACVVCCPDGLRPVIFKIERV